MEVNRTDGRWQSRVVTLERAVHCESWSPVSSWGVNDLLYFRKQGNSTSIHVPYAQTLKTPKYLFFASGSLINCKMQADRLKHINYNSKNQAENRPKGTHLMGKGRNIMRTREKRLKF